MAQQTLTDFVQELVNACLDRVQERLQREVHTHIYIYKHARVHTHIYTYTNMHAYTHTHTQRGTHTNMHMYTHTHTKRHILTVRICMSTGSNDHHMHMTIKFLPQRFQTKTLREAMFDGTLAHADSYSLVPTFRLTRCEA